MIRYFYITNLSLCSQEEAETRAFLHRQDIASNCFSKMKLRLVDTDVVVIGFALYDEFDGLQGLWMDFGVDKSRPYYPIHKIVIDPGGGRCKALIFSHAYTGYDQVSYFTKCDKSTAWKI